MEAKMNAFKCPACGASLFEGSAMCSSCKSDIDWQRGQPVITSAGRAFKRVVIVILIAVVAAALILAAILLVVSKT
jgi:uncharacterized membrane protein YvbJ